MMMMMMMIMMIMMTMTMMMMMMMMMMTMMTMMSTTTKTTTTTTMTTKTMMIMMIMMNQLELGLIYSYIQQFSYFPTLPIFNPKRFRLLHNFLNNLVISHLSLGLQPMIFAYSFGFTPVWSYVCIYHPKSAGFWAIGRVPT